MILLYSAVIWVGTCVVMLSSFGHWFWAKSLRAHLHVDGMWQFMLLTKTSQACPLLFILFWCLFLSLWPFNCVFHSINSPYNSLLSHSVLPVLCLPYWSFQLYISVKGSFSPDIILCGWPGLKHQLSKPTSGPGVCHCADCSMYCFYSYSPSCRVLLKPDRAGPLWVTTNILHKKCVFTCCCGYVLICRRGLKCNMSYPMPLPVSQDSYLLKMSPCFFMVQDSVPHWFRSRTLVCCLY